MRTFNRFISFSLCAFFMSTTAFAANTVIYESKDSKGQLVLSDVPTTGAKVVKNTNPVPSKEGGYIAWKAK